MKNNKKIKKLALLTAMLFITVLLAGCGGAGVSTGSVRVQVAEVVDKSESILTNALVGIQNDGEGDSGAVIHRQYSKPNGQGNTYVFRDLPPNVPYDVYASAFGYINEDLESQGYQMGGAPNRNPDESMKRITLEDGEDYFMKIYMKKNPTPSTGHLEGYVRGIDPANPDAAGQPLANATVILATNDGETAFSAVTDSSGYYMISSAPVDPQGFFLGCFAANDQGPNQIYKPLEPGMVSEETGMGGESKVYLVAGDTVKKDIYLEKTVMETEVETGGVISAIVMAADGFDIDYNATPIFATLYKDGEPYVTRRVQDGLIEFDNLPISSTGIYYDRIVLTSAFIEGGEDGSNSQSFSALLTNQESNYSLDAPFDITLHRGTIQISLEGRFQGDNESGSDRIDLTAFVEGGQQANIQVTRNSPNGTATVSDVPIGSRTVTATVSGTSGNATSFTSVEVTPTETQVTVLKGSDISGVAAFNATATK
ncbi:MAG: carboxypeptidase-like regulatory domain-containing protein [Candidatus Muiribacteriota bacterium]